MKQLVILGTGGFAREALWLVEAINAAAGGEQQPFNVAGFVAAEAGGHVRGLPVLGDDAWALDHLDHEVRFVPAVGDPALRKSLAERYEAAGFKAISLIHPSVQMASDVRIGRGSLLCAGAVLTTHIDLGAYAIVNLNATIGHDCRIGDFVTVHPGANISGDVTIGTGSEIGTGAAILPGVELGPETVLGAGAVVTKSLEGKATYAGVPVRQISGPAGK